MMELVIGGSGSGKSAYAENAVCREHCRALEKGKNVLLYYIADMIPYGEETEKKIAHHREMRAGKGFRTLEWYYGLAEHISQPGAPRLEKSSVLLECISNLTANEMYEPGGAGPDGAADAVIRGVRMLRERCRNLVVVTNDVFRESASDSEEMILYKKNLARINRVLAKEADQLTEVVSGIPVQIRKDEKSMEHRKSEESAGLTLILGGAYQGKRAYAEKISPNAVWADGKECAFTEIENADAIDRFQLLVKRWMLAGKSVEELRKNILGMNRDILIICDEIGCGLVPVDAFEREYREAVGRVCTDMAIHARRVDRVVCGIGMRMK